MAEQMDEATRAQITAAAPAASTWVSANAGSGKTRVLTNRVARILLTGCRPERILCLTFTKAAAAEMQGRLFSTLGEWAMLPEPDLRARLASIGENGLTPEQITRARTLFASALETPGGLKIQTIHAFCANLLRRFPVEAGVPPRFTEIDDRAAALLRADVLDAMARDEASSAFATMSAHLGSDTKLNALLLDILKHRRAFEGFDGGKLRQALDIDETTIDEVNARAIATIDLKALRDIAHVMGVRGGKTDAKNTAPIRELVRTATDAEALTAVRTALFTQTDAPRALKSFPSSKLGDDQAGIRETFEDIQAILAEWKEQVARISMRDRCEALAPFAREFLHRYDAAKADSGLVDFDDLISLAGDLLARPDVGPWVLYKLDGGIEHILVDEAQDTSPEQWRVIAALEEEFSSGEGAVERDRTLFVVGDKKQSIFSFQGADPGEFDSRETFFSERLSAVGRPFTGTELLTSFRTAAPILDLVDRTFANDAETGALGGAPRHIARDGSLGRVDIWPFAVKERTQTEEPDLDVIEDLLNKPDPVRDLAADLADYIAAISGTETIPSKDGPRCVTAGDILVLVRSRSPFFHLLIDGLKARDVPVAGADRLKIGEEIAVKDLLSTLRFLDATYDDLSLAEALRSPVFGLCEDDLFRIAHDRGGQTLFQSLIASEAHPQTEAMLRDLLRRTDFERPYEILERILMHHGARRRLTERLGSECEDAIDELLAEALAFERSSTPSLTGFLAWMNAQEIEVKRNMEAGRGEVRVMTVHGAKGLEAPVVILPDVNSPKFSHPAEVIEIGGLPFWNVSKSAKPELLQAVETERQEAERREHARLLYVALTRAESWLILCGAGQANKDRWHERVAGAAEGMGPTPILIADRQIDRIESHGWPRAADVLDLAADPPALPAWTGQAPPPAPPSGRPLNPSTLPGTHALPGEVEEEYGEEEAKARGNIIHNLLDILPGLPAEERATAAQAIVGPEPQLKGAADEAMALLSDPDLSHVFAPGALIEPPFAAKLNRATWEGRMDRVILTDQHATVIDFKTNRIVPKNPGDVPTAILAQMGAYTAALEAIFPGRTVIAAILWTKTRTLMTLPHDAVMAAFKNAAKP